MTKFIKLDTEIIPFFWSDISPLFNKVINNQGKGRDSLELVRYKLDNNLLQAWVYRNNNIIEAAYCTNVIEYPDKKSLFWGYMGAKNNNLLDWKMPLVKSLRDYAMLNECSCVEFFSNRKGWLKIFKDTPINFQEIGTAYEATINE
jgi:hypothetical protein|tara:strand:+ start:512 stop:949 length:438 start_codon:yes stop_codon:yes gene_type:complete